MRSGHAPDLPAASAASAVALALQFTAGSIAPAAIATPLRQTGTTRFVTEAPATALTSGVASIVEFQLDETGRAVSFPMDNGRYRCHRTD